MIRIPYLHCPAPLTLAVMVAFLVTWAVLKPLTAQSGQSSTADTTISSETQSPDNEPNRAQPTSAPDKGNIDSVTDVEIQRRFNELQRELLYDRHEFLDKRAKDVDWWLTAIVVFLTLTAVFLTFFAIVVAIIGIFGFQRFREIEAKAEKHAEEAERVVEHIKARRDEADSLLKDMNAETTHNDPDKASEVVETVQQNPAATLIDRAVADAISLQQQGKVEEAGEKWRSIAKVAEGVDSQLQARAWFSVGYLYGEKADWEAAIDAYTRTIRLDPNRAEAYNNRGAAKNDLGQHQDAIADYDKAIQLKANNSEAHNNRGNAKSGLGQHQDAIADYDKAIQLKANNANAYNGRGNAKRELGRLNEAREDYQKALALAQESGNEDLIAMAQRNLIHLDNDKAP